MDQRYYPRTTVSLPVKLYEAFDDRRYPGSFNTRDISYDGVFLNTGSSDLDCYEILDLRLESDGDGGKLEGIVMYSCAEGVGILLVDYSNRRVFDAMVYGLLNLALPVNEQE